MRTGIGCIARLGQHLAYAIVLRRASQLVFAGIGEGFPSTVFPLQGQAETLGNILKAHLQTYRTMGCGACHLPFPGLVVVSPEHITTPHTGHRRGKEAVALCSVDTETTQTAVAIHIAKAIAIGKGGGARHYDAALRHILHTTDLHSTALGSIHRCHTALPAMQEIVGKAARETALRVGGEGEFGTAE